MFSKKINILLPLGITVILSALMLYYTGSIPAFGEWYSNDQTLRLQTEAFLRGELAIQPVPYGHHHDWAWANGAHQCWGLGVPILQLPFNALAKLWGFFGFPDRIAFLLYYAAVAMVFMMAFNTAQSSTLDRGAERMTKQIGLIPIFCFVFLNPAFIIMLKAKSGPYEEVIAYSYLWSLLLFALLYLFLTKRTRTLYFLICLAAGFSLNLRPTIGAYGGMTFIAAFFLAKRCRSVGVLFFLSGLIFFLTMNYLRFGSPFEPGFKLVLTSSTFSDYVTRFDNTMRWVPLWSAALELVSALFFLDLKSYALTGELPWQIDAPRFREINFKSYDAIECFLLLLSWGLITLTWIRNKRKSPPSESENASIVFWGLLWSFGSFVMIFAFYALNPGLISRYFADFGPAIEIGIVMLYLHLATRLVRLPGGRSFPIAMPLGLAMIGWTFSSLIQADIIPLYQHLSKVELTNATTADVAQKQLAEARHLTGPQLPEGYRCGDQEIRYDIPYNNTEWDASGSCMVLKTSTHFLEDPDCLSLSIAPVPEIQGQLGTAYSDTEIEVRVGIETWKRMTEEPAAEGGKIISYCSQGNKGYENPDYIRLKLVSIKWLDWRKHPELSSPPLRLFSIWKSK